MRDDPRSGERAIVGMNGNRKSTRWWWVRHAPVTTSGGRIYGQRDVPADTSDPRPYEALARWLPAGAVLVTSHLQRTVQTADAIRAAGAALPPPVAEPDLAEQNFGAWQGRPRDEVYAAFGEGNPFWAAPATTRAPDGESFAYLVGRVGGAIERLTDAHAGRDIVAVTHGGTIRAAIGLALGLSPEDSLRFRIDNCSLTRLDLLAPGAPSSGCWAVAHVNQHVDAAP